MEYLHQENKGKKFRDWRLPENRMEGFFRWLNWRLKYGDIDHFICNNAYRDADGEFSPTGKPMDFEQKCWFSLLFGMTYQSDMAWVIYWNFPNFWNINLEKLQKWNVENMDRQKYARDAKYNKGRVAMQVDSIQKIVGSSGSFKNFFNQYMGDNENESFERVFEVINTFYKYGRMTSWLTSQVLHETAGLPLKPNDVKATHPSNWSVRSGLVYCYNKDDKVEALKEGVKFTDDDIKWIKNCELELYQKSLERIDKEFYPIFTNFVFETHLCQFKSMLIMADDYPGHTASDHMTRASGLAKNWPEVNFGAYFKNVVPHYHPLVQNKMLSRALDTVCTKTGQMINMHDDYEDMPDMYYELGINPNWFFEKGTYEEVTKNKINLYSKKIGGDNNWW